MSNSNQKPCQIGVGTTFQTKKTLWNQGKKPNDANAVNNAARIGVHEGFWNLGKIVGIKAATPKQVTHDK